MDIQPMGSQRWQQVMLTTQKPARMYVRWWQGGMSCHVTPHHPLQMSPISEHVHTSPIGFLVHLSPWRCGAVAAVLVHILVVIEVNSKGTPVQLKMSR